MGAAGTEAAVRLTKGELFILGYLGERTDGDGEITWQVTVDSGLATADAMLRRLREAGLVSSSRVADASNRKFWQITPQGREALDVRRWREYAIQAMTRELKPHLSLRGWDYARGWARFKLELARWEPPSHGLGARDQEHVRNVVTRYLDGATGCR